MVRVPGRAAATTGQTKLPRAASARTVQWLPDGRCGRGKRIAEERFETTARRRDEVVDRRLSPRLLVVRPGERGHSLGLLGARAFPAERVQQQLELALEVVRGHRRTAIRGDGQAGASITSGCP
jgi:hypothetical protein